jgi:hypothetical protein
MENNIFFFLLLGSVLIWIFIVILAIKIIKSIFADKEMKKLISNPKELLEKLNENKFIEKIGNKENEISFKKENKDDQEIISMDIKDINKDNKEKQRKIKNNLKIEKSRISSKKKGSNKVK